MKSVNKKLLDVVLATLSLIGSNLEYSGDTGGHSEILRLQEELKSRLSQYVD